jgi:hypothetical protein
MVQSIVVGQDEGATLNSSDLSSTTDNFGQHNIAVTNSGNKGYRYDPNTNEVTEAGVSTYQSQPTQFINAQGNYSATFDPNGSVVLEGGITTSAKVAMKMGMINEEGNLTAQAPQQVQQQQVEQPQQNFNTHDSFAMSANENAIVDDALPSNLSGSQVQTVLNQSTEAAVTGDFSKVVNSLVQNSGIDPKEAAERVNQAYSAYAKAGERYLSDVVGLKDATDRQNFYSWAQESAPQALRGAINTMISRNQFQELGKLVGQWLDATPPTVEALEKAGYQIGKASDGEPTVYISGFGQVAIKNAGRYL